MNWSGIWQSLLFPGNYDHVLCMYAELIKEERDLPEFPYHQKRGPPQ